MNGTGIIVVDTETTGLDVQRDRVIEVAWKRGLRDEMVVRRRFNPQVKMDPEVVKIHGITDKMLAQEPVFHADGVWQSLARELEDAVVWVGYNPQFDIEMLMQEFSRCGHTFRPPRMVVDPKRLWEPPERRQLQDAYKKFVDPAGFTGAHSADRDVEATAAVLLAQLAQLDLNDKTWEELDPERATWWGPTSHLQWAPWEVGRRGAAYEGGTLISLVCSFGRYKGRCVFSIEHGYWRWVLNQDFPSHVKQLASALLDKTKTNEQVHHWAWRQYR